MLKMTRLLKRLTFKKLKVGDDKVNRFGIGGGDSDNKP